MSFYYNNKTNIVHLVENGSANCGAPTQDGIYILKAHMLPIGRACCKKCFPTAVPEKTSMNVGSGKKIIKLGDLNKVASELAQIEKVKIFSGPLLDAVLPTAQRIIGNSDITSAQAFFAINLKALKKYVNDNRHLIPLTKAQKQREKSRQAKLETQARVKERDAELAAHGISISRKSTPKEPQAMVLRPAVKRPTEESVKSFIDNHSKVDPTSDDFLNTFEWKAVRMMSLKRHGYKCLCCGATPATGTVIHVDHIKPRKFFPELALDVDNTQTLCSDCNAGKGNWDTTDFRTTGAAA